jgi:hypothetical protein
MTNNPGRLNVHEQIEVWGEVLSLHRVRYETEVLGGVEDKE